MMSSPKLADKSPIKKHLIDKTFIFLRKIFFESKKAKKTFLLNYGSQEMKVEK